MTSHIKTVWRTTGLALVCAGLITGCNQASDASHSTPAAVNTAENSIATDQKNSVTLVRSDGSYPTRPLEKDVIVVKVLQTTVDSLQDFDTIPEGLDHNLTHMEAMAEKACTTGKKPDFLLYHEFPLTGYSSGTRDEKLKYTVQIPGPETERLGKVARDCDSYIVFGTYATDDDWPGHILSINAVIDRQGKVAKAFWKSRNIKNYSATTEIPTTTVENVRDRYRAMYGIEEEFPVLQTEYGNIAVSTVQWDPFVFAAFAMRGVEIMFRTATLFQENDVTATAKMNDFYSTMTNIAFKSERYRAGESIIVGPDGKLMAKSPSLEEDDIIEAEIPIAEFRKGRSLPSFALDLTMPVIEQYVPEFPLNHLDIAKEDLPQTGEDMKALMQGISRYKD